MSLPKYVVNFDELDDLFGDGITVDVTVGDSKVSDLLRELFEKFPPFIKIPVGLFGNYNQRSVGLHSYIPALGFDYELTHIFDEDVFLTGLAYSQTGWKVMDCWSLLVGDDLIFDGLYTKELGEHKHFNVFYPVARGTEIKVIHHNHSGNSKQVWFDIDYIMKGVEPPGGPVDPGTQIPVFVCLGENIEIGYVSIPPGFTGTLEITMRFATESGEAFPDLEVVAPNSDGFGYTREFLTGAGWQETSTAASSTRATYTGWNSNPERMTFENPMPGNWYLFAQSVMGTRVSEVFFSSNQPVHVTYSRP